MKTYEESVTTNFYNKKGSKKIPDEKIILDSVLHA